jgi:hypothetical protein
MKRFIFAAASCIVAVMLLAAFFVIRDVSGHSRRLCAMQDVKRLGVIVEWHRQAHDEYPASLKALEADATPEQKKDLDELRAHWGETSDYRRLPTGFTITLHRECCRYESLTNGYIAVVGQHTNINVPALPTLKGVLLRSAPTESVKMASD